MNAVILMGNLGRDPELRQTNNGKSVCELSLATSSGRDQAEWHRVVCWDKTAEVVAEHKRKGDSVVVEGRLVYRDWEDKQGNKRKTAEVVAHRVHFVAGGQRGSNTHAPQEPDAGGGSGGSFDDNEIPF